MWERRERRVVWVVRTWVARVEVVWRWGGRGEGVREGWVEERAWRRGGEVKMGSSCWELGGGLVRFGGVWGQGKRGLSVRFVEENFGEPVFGRVWGRRIQGLFMALGLYLCRWECLRWWWR